MKILTKREIDRIETSLAQVYLDVILLEGSIHPDTYKRITAGIRDAVDPIDDGVFTKQILNHYLD